MRACAAAAGPCCKSQGLDLIAGWSNLQPERQLETAIVEIFWWHVMIFCYGQVMLQLIHNGWSLICWWKCFIGVSEVSLRISLINEFEQGITKSACAGVRRHRAWAPGGQTWSAPCETSRWLWTVSLQSVGLGQLLAVSMVVPPNHPYNSLYDQYL